MSRENQSNKPQLSNSENSHPTKKYQPLRPSHFQPRIEAMYESPEFMRVMNYRRLLIKYNASAEIIKNVEDFLRILQQENVGKQVILENRAPASSGEQQVLKAQVSMKDNSSSQPNEFAMDVENVQPNMAAGGGACSMEFHNNNNMLNPSNEGTAEKASSSHPVHWQPGEEIGSFLRSLLPEKPSNSELGAAAAANRRTSFDDEIDMLTKKMANSTLTPMCERDNKGCICYRKVRKTVCKACGQVMAGRALRRCVYHPRIAFPNDIWYCTGCCADVTDLHEIPDA